MQSLWATRDRRPGDKLWAAIIFALACASGSALAASGTTYVLQLVDYPGADYTALYGINDDGGIVGNAHLPGDVNDIGFVYDPVNGFKILPVAPGYEYASADGINDSGALATTQGSSDAATNTLLTQTGALYANGRYSLFSHPGSQFTAPRAIGVTGVITGYAYDIVSCDDFPGCQQSAHFVGFLYNPATGSFTDILNPIGTPDDVISVQGINSVGQAVGNAEGTYKGEFGGFGFVRDPKSGNMRLFSVANSIFTNARGINDAGAIAGFITVQGGERSFVKTAKSTRILPAPAGAGNADQVAAEAINNMGQVSGVFVHFLPDGSHSSQSEGFIATPVIAPTGTTAQGGQRFSADVLANDPVFLGAPSANEFRYVSSTLPFTTVRLPIGVGDNRYTILVGVKSYPVAAGELFDFRTHGFPGGVYQFTVKGIEVASTPASVAQVAMPRSTTRGTVATAAAVDLGPTAFATELTFGRTGTFVGQMLPQGRGL